MATGHLSLSLSLSLSPGRLCNQIIAIYMFVQVDLSAGFQAVGMRFSYGH